MGKSNKILVTTDFSDESLGAIHYAAEVAKKIGGEIVMLHVMETYEYNSVLEKNLGEGYENALRQAIEQKLEDFRTQNSNVWGVRMTSMLRKGKIHKEIQEVAKEIDARLIVMGTHGASGSSDLERFVLGSNAYRTVNSTRCPVFTVQENGKDKITFDNIILPLDITKSTTKKVDTAIAWAKEFNSTVHVVAVVEFFDEFRKNLEDLLRQLDEVAERLKAEGIKTETAMIRNTDVAKGVMNYAEENNGDLIIIMTQQETLLNRYLLGSHARKVISESKIPVLSVRPQED